MAGTTRGNQTPQALDEINLPTVAEDASMFDIDDDETITDPLTVEAGIDNG